MNGSEWSDDRVEALKRLWNSGLSASQIACELGNVTRNAVIGKVSRLGLSGRASKPLSTPKPRKVRDRMVRVARPLRPSASALAHVLEVEAEALPSGYVIPLHQRKSLIELTDENCHFPVGDVGDPDFHFCGGNAVEGAPYCARHARLSYRPATSRPDAGINTRLSALRENHDWRR